MQGVLIKGMVGVAAISIVVAGGSGVALAGKSHGPHHKHHGGHHKHKKAKVCRTNTDQQRFLLGNGGRIKPSRASCAAAKQVATTYSADCLTSFEYVLPCTVHAGRRAWACRNVVHSLDGTMSSTVTCRTGGGKKRHARKRRRKTRGRSVKFTTGLAPYGAIGLPSGAAVEGGGRGAGRATATHSPWRGSSGCIDTSNAGQTVATTDVYEIHALGVPVKDAEALAGALVAHQTGSIFHVGLGDYPRGAPGRKVPIYLIPKGDRVLPVGSFVEAAGLQAKVCSGGGTVDATIVQDDPTTRESIAAHEIFHAFATGFGGGDDNWLEEAAATWGSVKAGFKDPGYGPFMLNHPNAALDTFDKQGHQYGAWRFVQWLEFKGFIADPSWGLLHDQLRYSDNQSQTDRLAAGIQAQGGSLGKTLGEFWGDAINDQPFSGPGLGAPTGARYEIKTGETDFSLTAGRLGARFKDFRVARGIKQLTFEFDQAPANGHTWARLEGGDSEEISGGKTIAYCVDGPDSDSKGWPGTLPVIFTNGNPAADAPSIDLHVTISASKSTAGCAASNPQCQLLEAAGVERYFDGDDNRFLPGSRSCTYNSQRDPEDDPVDNDSSRYGNVSIDQAKFKGSIAKEIKRTRKLYKEIGGEEIKGIGDYAAVVQRGNNSPLITFITGHLKTSMHLYYGNDHKHDGEMRGALIDIANSVADNLH